jgi:micrococcal nuclease
VRRGAPLLLLLACGAETTATPDEGCGPASARIVAVTDGDTVISSEGEKIRYLLVDTNEITGGRNDCFGQEARRYNEALVLEKTVELAYGEACRDRFGRLLAYVSVEGREINELLIERGYGCVLYIPPNGGDRREALEALEARARAEHRGMWGACPMEEIACAE